MSDWLSPASSDKLKLVQKGHFYFSTENAYQNLTFVKVCDWSGHVFGASASPRSTKKMAVTLFRYSWRSA